MQDVRSWDLFLMRTRAPAHASRIASGSGAAIAKPCSRWAGLGWTLVACDSRVWSVLLLAVLHHAPFGAGREGKEGLVALNHPIWLKTHRWLCWIAISRYDPFRTSSLDWFAITYRFCWLTLPVTPCLLDPSLISGEPRLDSKE
jgi:hypothetical protein